MPCTACRCGRTAQSGRSGSTSTCPAAAGVRTAWLPIGAGGSPSPTTDWDASGSSTVAACPPATSIRPRATARRTSPTAGQTGSPFTSPRRAAGRFSSPTPPSPATRSTRTGCPVVPSANPASECETSDQRCDQVSEVGITQDSARLPGRGPGRYYPGLASLDLQRQELGVDPALGEAARGKPEALLAGAAPHVPELPLVVVTPDGPDALCDRVAEEPPHEILLAEISGREDHGISLQSGAVGQLQAIGREGCDVVELDQAYLPVDQQLRAADIQVIAASAPQVLHLESGVVGAVIELEANRSQALQDVLVAFCQLAGEQLIRMPQHRVGRSDVDEVGDLSRVALPVDRVDLAGGVGSHRYYRRGGPLHQRDRRPVAPQILGHIVPAGARADDDHALAGEPAALIEGTGVEDLAPIRAEAIDGRLVRDAAHT